MSITISKGYTHFRVYVVSSVYLYSCHIDEIIILMINKNISQKQWKFVNYL